MPKKSNRSLTYDQLLARELKRDPKFRREWERLEFARVVASKVINYRAENNLTQRALATKLGIPQSQVARLENAEHQPSHDTLARLTALGMEFSITFKPNTQPSTSIRRRKRVFLTVKTANSTISYTAV